MENYFIQFDEKEIFDFLTKPEIPNTKECFEFFKKYYQVPDSDELYHHFYSEIMENLKKYEDEQKEQICAKILETIQDESLWDKNSELRKTVIKLYDHTSLEVKRSYYNKQLENAYENNLVKKSQELQKLIEAQQIKIDRQRKNIENHSKELTNQTLTVMSIFTAVVFAAITSFDVMTSISAAAVNRFTVWGILVILIGMAVASIDVFYLLLRFICHIITRRSFIPFKVIQNINFVAFILFVCFVIISLVYPQYIIL